jgi:undecaprenyl pyrophosphate phosphatase UppP
MESEKKRYPLRTLIWVLLVIGFMIMEFPGIFFINRIDPMIFGMPFIYGFTIIMWVFMCIILFVGYKTNWGKGASFAENPDAQD